MPPRGQDFIDTAQYIVSQLPFTFLLLNGSRWRVAGFWMGLGERDFWLGEDLSMTLKASVSHRLAFPVS